MTTKIKALTAIQRRPKGPEGKIEEVPVGAVFDATDAEIRELDRMRTVQHPIYSLATEVDEAEARRLAAQGIRMVQEVERVPRRNPKTGEVREANRENGLFPEEEALLRKQQAEKSGKTTEQGTNALPAGTSPEPSSGSAVPSGASAAVQEAKPVRVRRTRAQIEADEAAAKAAADAKARASGNGDDSLLG